MNMRLFFALLCIVLDMIIEKRETYIHFANNLQNEYK